MPNVSVNFKRIEKDKRDLFEKILNRVKSEEKEDKLIDCVMHMTHNALNASATSLLLFDDSNRELYFKFAEGPVSHQVKRLHISRQSGVAGWIARHGRPLIVNDPEKNASFYKFIDTATGFKTRSIIGVPVMIGNTIVGVIEALNRKDGKDFTARDLQTMKDVSMTTALVLERARKNSDLLDSYKGTVEALVSLADAKEMCSGGHSRRVTEYVLMGADNLSLSPEEKSDIEYAAIFHDIGKLGIPDSILNKLSALTPEEWAIVRKHPATGYELLKNISFLKESSRLILYHHERYDGKGYPKGIKGEDIPLGSRLLAVADAFDHMTTDHAYRKARNQQLAFAELHKQVGTQFCPIAVKAFNSGFVMSSLMKKQASNKVFNAR